VDGELSVIGRLAAGACAGMTSTFVSNAVVYQIVTCWPSIGLYEVYCFCVLEIW
jgi:hypothetical protein